MLLPRVVTVIFMSSAALLGALWAFDTHVDVRIKVFHLSLRAIISASLYLGVDPSSVVNCIDPYVAAEKGPDGITIADLVVPPLAKSVYEGITDLEEVRVRVHYNEENTAKLPIVVFLHGGGFTLGNASHLSSDRLVRYFVKGGPFVAVTVDYRLAPKYTLPAAIDDSIAAILWAHAAQDPILKRHGDPSRLILLGDGTGASLVAVATQYISQNYANVKIANQILLYPIFNLPATHTVESHNLFEQEYFNWKEFAQYQQDLSTPKEAQFKKSPLYLPTEGKLVGLPTGQVVIAQLDRSSGEGILYAEALKNAGVNVVVHSYPTVHGFLSLDFLPESQLAFEEVLATVKSQL